MEYTFYTTILNRDKTSKNFDKELANYDKLLAKNKELKKQREQIAKSGVEELVTKQDEIEFDIAHDKDGNMCIGYFIVSKVGEGIDIDASHMCDMINY